MYVLFKIHNVVHLVNRSEISEVIAVLMKHYEGNTHTHPNIYIYISKVASGIQLLSGRSC